MWPWVQEEDWERRWTLNVSFGLYLFSESHHSVPPSLTTRRQHERLDCYPTAILETKFLWLFPPGTCGEALADLVIAGRAGAQLALWSQVMLDGGWGGSMSCHCYPRCQFRGWNQMVSMPPISYLAHCTYLTNISLLIDFESDLLSSLPKAESHRSPEESELFLFGENPSPLSINI